MREHGRGDCLGTVRQLSRLSCGGPVGYFRSTQDESRVSPAVQLVMSLILLVYVTLVLRLAFRPKK